MEHPWQFCIRCYKRFPNDVDLPYSPCCGTNLVTLSCARCGTPVEGTGVCLTCGFNQTAPPCPQCGAPVAQSPDNTRQGRWFGSVVWNTSWHKKNEQPECPSCGHPFTQTLKVGPSYPGSGEGESQDAQSEITIGAGSHSLLPEIDTCIVKPVIELRIRRQYGEGNMPEEEHITLTPEEWKAIRTALEGDLQPLTRQKSWWWDMT